jgi:hypothetical protein
VSVGVDGRAFASLRWRENYPLQYEPLGRLTLAAGRHRFDITRGGGSVLPGTGNEIAAEGIITRIGPLALIRRGARPRVRTVSASAALRGCRGGPPVDWVDVVRAR